MSDYIAELWAADIYDTLEFARTINRLLGIPEYEHRRQWDWWHDYFCASCRRVNDTPIGSAEIGGTIRMPKIER